jgi:hypothetical protein
MLTLLATALVLGSAACHAGAAEDSCERLANQLYDARGRGDVSTVRSLLSTGMSESQVASLLEHDETYGVPGARRRFLTLSIDHDKPGDTHYYSVRLGFKVRFGEKEREEIVECRVEESGVQGHIDHIEMGGPTASSVGNLVR